MRGLLLMWDHFPIAQFRVSNGSAGHVPGQLGLQLVDLAPQCFVLSAGPGKGNPGVCAGSLCGEGLPVAVPAQKDICIALPVLPAPPRPLLHDSQGFDEPEMVVGGVSAAQPGDLAEEGGRHRDLAPRVGVAAQSVADESDGHGQMMNRSLDELDDMRQPEGDCWMDIGFCGVDRGVGSAVVVGGRRTG